MTFMAAMSYDKLGVRGLVAMKWKTNVSILRIPLMVLFVQRSRIVTISVIYRANKMQLITENKAFAKVWLCRLLSKNCSAFAKLLLPRES